MKIHHSSSSQVCELAVPIIVFTGMLAPGDSPRQDPCFGPSKKCTRQGARFCKTRPRLRRELGFCRKMCKLYTSNIIKLPTVPTVRTKASFARKRVQIQNGSNCCCVRAVHIETGWGNTHWHSCAQESLSHAVTLLLCGTPVGDC